MLSDVEKRKELLDYSIKCVDIDGKVYTTMPSRKVEFISSPIEVTIPTNIRLNYENKSAVPPIFSDIELE